MKAAVLRKADPELKEKRCDASPSDSGGSSAAVGLPLFLRRTAPGPGHARALGQASRVPVRSALPAFLATAPIQAFGGVSVNVSSPQDVAEKEATDTAKKIMRLAVPESSVSPVKSHRGGVFRQVTQSAAPAVPKVASNVAANMRNDVTLGSPLPPAIRGFMEPRFRADLRNIRIHTGEPAAKLNRGLRARAFATGNHIFFGKDRFQPQSEEGKELIAHELTHTIQQGAVVQRSADMSITQQPSAQVQRQEEGGGEDQGTVLNYFAREANLIPGFRMFTIVLGVNPITMSKVQRNAANILRALIELLPMGGLITQALDNSGVFDKAGAFVERQLATLAITGDAIKQAVKDFMAGLGLLDLAHPGNLWERAKRIFTDPIDRIIRFAEGLVNDIVQLVKDAILRPIAKLAEGTAGYDLLKAVLGKDPITEEPVEPTPENLIGPFMKLIGEEGVWETMKEAKAVPSAWAWFQKAVGDLTGFVREIPILFVNALKSLQLEDIILVPTAFAKLANVFGGFLVRFTNWGMNAVWNLLEIIFDVVSPGALGYIKKTGSALKNILKNPLPFVGNLVKAAKLGFQNFAHNFLAHLKAGLIDWLTGSLPGVYIPKAFSLGEIVKFAFSVLGLTWANVRQKLVKVVGEPAVKAMETGFDIVVTLVTQGPAAAWDKIKEQLANLQDMVIGGITDFVVDMVVQKAVPKLIAMFIPGAGFISAIVSIYDTVMVFVNKLSQIAQVVSGFIDSIVAIAGGVIGAAATRVETTLAGLLSLAINFLAGFAGLGKVADKVIGVINKVRAPIDKALDWLINWIVTMAKRLFAKVFGKKDGNDKKDQPKPSQIGKTISWSAAGESHKLWIAKETSGVSVRMASAEEPVEAALDEFEEKAKSLEGEKRAKTSGLISHARKNLAGLHQKAQKMAQDTKNPEVKTEQTQAEEGKVESEEDRLAAVLGQIREALGLADPDRIKADVAAEIQRLPRLMESEEDLAGALREIFSRHEPRGLKKLDIQRTGAEYDVLAEASAAKFSDHLVGLTKDGAGGCSILIQIDGKIIMDPEDEIAQVVWNAGGGGPHAEARLYKNLSIIKDNSNPTSLIEIWIRYSPCQDRCGFVLDHIEKAIRSTHPNVAFRWYFEDLWIKGAHTRGIAEKVIAEYRLRGIFIERRIEAIEREKLGATGQK